MGTLEKQFKVGACTAYVFNNEVQSAEGMVGVASVSIRRRYKDKEGSFRETTSFGLNDLPKAITALIQAYWFILSQPIDMKRN